MKKHSVLFAVIGVLIVALGVSAFLIYSHQKEVDSFKSGNMADKLNISRSSLTKVVISNGYSINDTVTLKNKSKLDAFVKSMRKTVIQREKVNKASNVAETNVDFYCGSTVVSSVKYYYDNMEIGGNDYNIVKGPLDFSYLFYCMQPVAAAQGKASVIDTLNINMNTISKIGITYGGTPFLLKGKKQIDNLAELMDSTIVKKEKVPLLSHGEACVVVFYYRNKVIPVGIRTFNLSLNIDNDLYDIVKGPLTCAKIESYYKTAKAS